MVLSNKKLKQKLREELAKSLSNVAAGANSKPDPDSQSQSLKELLDSASHKPRLSKREKRRKTQTCVGSDGSNTGISKKEEVEVVGDAENGQGSEEADKKKKKKRKRDDTEGDGLGEEGGGGGNKGGNEFQNQKKKDTKKKKKQKKKRQTNKTPKKAGESSAGEKVEKPKIEQIRVDSDSQADGVVPRKLYVGGIPYRYTEDEIRSYFRSCGVITNIDCKMRPEDGTFSGIAFITFETKDAANRALALDRAAIGDRFLTIQQYVKTPSKKTPGFNPERIDGYNRVYVGNLPWDTTEGHVRELFADCDVTSVRLGKNKETGEFKGYAHVGFKDSVSMAMALKLDQEIVRGRPVKISSAIPKTAGNTNSTPDEPNNDAVELMLEAVAEPMLEAVANEANACVSAAAPVTSGKIRRRTCYECGEKGHLSSACPKKQQQQQQAC